MLAASTTIGNRQPQGKESKFSDLGDLFSPSVAYSNRIAQSRSRPPEWQQQPTPGGGRGDRWPVSNSSLMHKGIVSERPMSTATDATLIALGERFEKLLLEHMDAWLTWAPRMRAARAEVEGNTASLAVAIQRTGCDVVQAHMSELERDMQPLAKEIIAAPATSLGGLRAKALVALWEAYPTHASHEGTFEFRDDGSRSLFEAVAVMTGLSPLVRELEARLAADVE